MILASGASNLKVVVGDEAPKADNPDALEGDDFVPFGAYKGKVKEGTKIKIKPSDVIPGSHVVIYAPVDDGTLALADVKVYVRPKGEVPGPGEPEGPNGPDGPDGPEDITEPNQETDGSGDNPENGNDGDPNTCFETDKVAAPFWTVDLEKEWEIVAVHILACSNNRKHD